MTDDNTVRFLEDTALEKASAELAHRLRPRGELRGGPALKALKRNLQVILGCRDRMERRFAAHPAPPAAVRWLLDNAYLARREAICAGDALRRCGRLRRCGGEALILLLCRSLCGWGQGRVTEERAGLCLEGFQSVLCLRRAELNLFPAALRCALLEELAGCCLALEEEPEAPALTGRMEAVFTSLRLFSVLDPEPLLRQADHTDRLLCADPTGDYPRMDSETRQDYLRRVEKLARREGLEEQDYARQLLKRAREEGKHLGFFLFSPPNPLWAGLYIGGNLALSLGLSLLAAFWAAYPPAFLLLLLPVSELVKTGLDALLRRLVPTRRLPRMDMRQGIPEEGRTICVISALLCDEQAARRMVRRLEELRLCCRREGENLLFGLLADLPEADSPRTPEDEPILRAAQTELNRLNRRYDRGFYLFTRPRAFDGERWTAPERKRGALVELARLLCDEDSALQVHGDRDALAGTPYILTLDSDTRLYPGAAGELIGAMLHPLNRPKIDEKRRVVVRGTGLIHPRLSADLESANATDFALIFAGAGGSDPYGGLCGELTMDAFSSGGFAGKGILSARCLLQCTASRIRPGRVLSHDAVEGACLHGAFLGDAEFSDAFPTRPLSYYKRLHRWVRGDWQNLPFIFSRDLAPIERWRLTDSLRRSLLPPATFLAILAGIFLPQAGLRLSAWAALLALISGLLLSLAEDGTRREARPRRLTRLLTGAGGALLRCFIRLWLLPWEAWICLSAALTALWRMGVSHRRLLQWQTAAQAEGGGAGPLAHLHTMWPAALAGLLLLLFAPQVLGKSVGFLWLLSPLCAYALSLPARREGVLNAGDRAYLRSAAEKLLGYYLRCCRPEDAYLPPDNLQEDPPVGLAHRSSPTNIGLALVSLVGAVDLQLLDREKAVSLLEKITGTLEALPRWRGHFYNWYDTRTLSPLAPALISTVDSGNLCASLITLNQALLDWGQEALAGRISRLVEEMDFSLLFDKRRCLFYICYDPAQDRGLGGWYDLMASEAMLTSYLAVARGQAPVKHWRRLSRAQLGKDGYRGMASWTGTMFEYLMPALFLPLYRGSLLRESGRFCLYAQKRRVPAGEPWGVSESGFYALDPARNYRYKANGVAALALKRGQDGDLVISPYSSFLALPLDPRGAVNNLRRLERRGMVGRYGFYEALDLTPERCRLAEGEPVRSWMAHHVGMSIIAAANALCEGSLIRRFLRDPAMGAYTLLLQERLPEGGQLLRRDTQRPPEKPVRAPWEPWSVQGRGAGDARCLLSNGAYQLLADSAGRSRAVWDQVSLYGSPDLELPGLSLSLERDGKPLPRTVERWDLGESQALWQREELEETLFAAAGELGECRLYRLSAGAGGQFRLVWRLRPILAPWRDYAAHPAFWELGILREAREGALLFRRLRRGSLEELWLCLRAEGAQAVPDGDRLILRLALRPGERRELRLALCLGRSGQEAYEGAGRILAGAEPGQLCAAAARRLGMGPEEIGAAMALLPALSRPLRDAQPREALWPWGVSGDDPILCCEAGAVEALPLLRRWLLLKSCGAESDLVYLSPESGEYRQPRRNQVREELARLGLEALLDSRRGVHFVPREGWNTLRSRSSYTVGAAPDSRGPVEMPSLSRPRAAGTVPAHRWEEGAFCFEAGDCLPPRAWQLPLSNSRLSAVAADCGPAALWMENARELRLVPPMAPEGTRGKELLFVQTQEGPVSLFGANDAHPCSVRFAPGLARWEKEVDGRRIVTELWIDPEADFRLIRIQGARGLRLSWILEPWLAPEDGKSLRCRFERGLFRAENPESGREDLRFLAGCGFCSCRTDFLPAAMRMELEGEEISVLCCGCGGEEALKALCRPDAAAESLARTRRFWRAKTGLVRLRTGDAVLDRYLNDWALYQVLACRLWARGSLYQSGGAYGFRDQLQDSVNLLPADPVFARERLLDACRHQYVQGDVMHWWHPRPQGDKGLRSRCGDDLLWLPWALCQFVNSTGDLSICRRAEPFLDSPPLGDGERDRYESPSPGESGTVLDHARAAVRCCVRRGFGPHGLPYFGSGDWNDGLDAVDGESVWLGWFLACVAGDLAGLLEKLGQPDSREFRALSKQMAEAAEGCWNGRWYARGYWADGSPLGGEERIDLLPQVWAAFCPQAHRGRVQLALDACMARLVDEDRRLIKLFDPPYSPEERYPGYLAGYGPGVRENGGQYTHGAVWLARALLLRGRRAEGAKLLRLLLPEGRDLARYEAEPFILPADVSAAPGCQGRAGWTWYTGSAGWFLRTAWESGESSGKSDFALPK